MTPPPLVLLTFSFILFVIQVINRLMTLHPFKCTIFGGLTFLMKATENVSQETIPWSISSTKAVRVKDNKSPKLQDNTNRPQEKAHHQMSLTAGLQSPDGLTGGVGRSRKVAERRVQCCCRESKEQVKLVEDTQSQKSTCWAPFSQEQEATSCSSTGSMNHLDKGKKKIACWEATFGLSWFDFNF